ncbi:MAG: NAD(P)H-dependent oxidoreductase [Steroidobacteraceae bacterium]|nr:flavodoxin family protein [Nevskiaceae bacterium]MCP5339359.1 flavodoxin family protein [Nevskiaceae bacterium]MCP5466542.1 flavodoxin family protein [Nevskiaceae bacterium]MCP5471360.1 flavodoxin family protein [Nevskiaceae bacterium]
MPAPHLLLIYGGHSGGRTERLRHAAVGGIKAAAQAAAADPAGGTDAAEPLVELRERHALEATLDDLLWADGLLFGTPEHFGYMSGALKDFFDRTFYPAEGRTEGRPYGLFVSAGNDGTGTATAVARIATGYRWKAIAEPLIVVGEPDANALTRCTELGATLAVGLAAGAF